MTEPFALTPQTEAGERFVTAVRSVLPAIADAAEEADREGRFVASSIDQLVRSGAFGAPVPARLGGMGLASFHDLAVGVFELGKACGSTAIASYMHLSATAMLGRSFEALEPRAEAADIEHLRELLQGVAEGREVIAVAISEPGTNATVLPLVEARRDGDHYVVNGTKIFGTLAQRASMLNTLVRVREEGDAKAPGRAAFALIGSDWEGVEVVDDWDAMGMRGSGSGPIHFRDVRVPARFVAGGQPLGQHDVAALYNALTANTGLIAAALGIAQAARDRVAASAGARKKAHDGLSEAERPAAQIAMGELDTLLFAARAMMARSALDVDAFYGSFTPRQATLEQVLRMTAAVRATKVFVERAAVRVVDAALQLSGGGGFMGQSPLSRHYRDVRAIPFMLPQASLSLPLIGCVGFGIEPPLG
ncbi:MAG: acyl-CoA/acyl-ACP dehydrogenase [Myxococcales bacterium]|nr:acyl-CoA/acyl-ACP dehydrogenase [Myxococcales bacterium]